MRLGELGQQAIHCVLQLRSNEVFGRTGMTGNPSIVQGKFRYFAGLPLFHRMVFARKVQRLVSAQMHGHTAPTDPYKHCAPDMATSVLHTMDR